jgi:hypothetical protein
MKAILISFIVVKCFGFGVNSIEIFWLIKFVGKKSEIFNKLCIIN